MRRTEMHAKSVRQKKPLYATRSGQYEGQMIIFVYLIEWD